MCKQTVFCGVCFSLGAATLLAFPQLCAPKPKSYFAVAALRCGPPAVIIHTGCQALLAAWQARAKSSESARQSCCWD